MGLLLYLTVAAYSILNNSATQCCCSLFFQNLKSDSLTSWFSPWFRINLSGKSGLPLAFTPLKILLFRLRNNSSGQKCLPMETAALWARCHILAALLCWFVLIQWYDHELLNPSSMEAIHFVTPQWVSSRNYTPCCLSGRSPYLCLN